MAFDFTLEKYEELCTTLLNNGYRTITVCDYINELPHKGFCILRHDVDRRPQNALRMAELENGLGITSTYYFRYPYTFRPEVVSKIAGMGHEIGYHYETLAKASGDYGRAIRMFEHELEEMRKTADVRTICMHGRPLSKHDNRDLWKVEDFRRFGLVAEAYLSIKNVRYFSDTGRSWNGKNNMRDFLCGQTNGSVSVDKTDEFIEYIKRQKPDRLYIVAHPERWSAGILGLGQSYMKDLLFNIGKRMLRAFRRFEYGDCIGHK